MQITPSLLSDKEKKVITQLLIQKNKPFYIPKTLLHMACYHNFKTATQALLLKKPRMATIPDEYRDTPLHTASYALHATCVKYILLTAPHSINCQNCDKQTALHLACNNQIVINKIPKTLKTVALLMSHGADITMIDHAGTTPLYYLFNCLYPHHGYISKNLIQSKDKHNNTQLHLCAQLASFDKNIFTEYIVFLISHELSLFTKNNAGQTAIDLAYENENNEVQENILTIFVNLLNY